MRFRKLAFIFPMLFCLMGASNCTGVKYKSDEGLMAPFQAKALEFPVNINGNVCRDMSGQIGACTLAISHRNDLKIELTPSPYAYNVNIQCSSALNWEYSNDVPKEIPHVVEITKDIYEDLDHFICIGKVTPQDDNFFSARWEMRIRLIDADYLKRANGFIFEDKDKSYINLGQHSKHVYVFDEGKWKYHKKKPVVRLKGKLEDVKAYSSSEIMRFNFFRFSF